MTATDEFYQTYLNSRHAKFNTPEKHVFEMARRATGRTPVSRRKIVKGNDKEIYFVTDAKGQEFVVVINQTDESFDGEVWCLETMRSANVPVPEVMLFDCLEDEEKPLQFMVQTKVSGQPLEDVFECLTPGQKQNALTEMGEVLARIHTVCTEGFYKRHADGAWDFRRWSKLIRARRPRPRRRARINFTSRIRRSRI